MIRYFVYTVLTLGCGIVIQYSDTENIKIITILTCILLMQFYILYETINKND